MERLDAGLYDGCCSLKRGLNLQGNNSVASSDLIGRCCACCIHLLLLLDSRPIVELEKLDSTSEDIVGISITFVR